MLCVLVECGLDPNKGSHDWSELLSLTPAVDLLSISYCLSEYIKDIPSGGTSAGFTQLGP